MLKKTKIVATISDINCDVAFVRQLFKAGMNVARLNTAHQTIEDTYRAVQNIRKVSEKIPIVLDTKGPEIRTNKSDITIELGEGDKIHVKGRVNQPSSADCL